MRDMDDYLRIRLLHRDGLSARKIAKRLCCGRDTVRKALLNASPPGYVRTAPRACPKLTAAHQATILAILKEDKSAPRKQRHTSMRIFTRLCDEHAYSGQYDQVRRFVSSHRKRERETHVLLDHPPGCRMECDFGHIHVDYPQGRELVAVLMCVWSYSHAPFAIALPNEKVESILHGMVCALEFFGCVPLEVWWDNPATVVSLILKGRDRKPNPHYAALASHYRFAPMFCMPARGQEKSDVERSVFALERRFATPVPSMKDIDDLNRHLLNCCLKERDRVVRGRSGGQALRTESIGAMFEQEKAQAEALPAHPFDACIQCVRQADKYQTVLFEEVRYSVPRPVAFETVTVKAYLNQIVIVHKGIVVARHRRNRTAGEQELEPMHYLSVLGRKPAYLDKTKLFTDWKLPATFTRLRKMLEQKHGMRTGARQYIRILQLLASHSVEDVESAILACEHRQTLGAEIIAQKLSTLSGSASTGAGSKTTADSIPHVHVPPPDLRRFDRLLQSHSSLQGESDVRDVAEAQPQDAQTADHAGRACEAVP
jgi:transposase